MPPAAFALTLSSVQRQQCVDLIGIKTPEAVSLMKQLRHCAERVLMEQLNAWDEFIKVRERAAVLVADLMRWGELGRLADLKDAVFIDWSQSTRHEPAPFMRVCAMLAPMLDATDL